MIPAASQHARGSFRERLAPGELRLRRARRTGFRVHWKDCQWRMAPHPRTFGSHTPLGHAVRVHWPAATWHIEIYNFRTELGIAVVEHEPIRRYHPQINWAYNTGRLRIEIAESQLRGPRMCPA